MAFFKSVEVWPYAGPADGLWCDTPEQDAFARTARSICELYSAGLRSARLESRCSSLRLITFSRPERADVLGVVATGRAEGFEYGRVYLPVSISGLSAETRAGLVLAVVHEVCVELAASRAWDVKALEVARRHVLQERMTFTWASAWKSSPDRRAQGRAVYELRDDGCGRVRLEVRSRDGERVWRSVPALSFSTSEGFTRSARTLRWRDSDSLSLVPFLPPFSAGSGLVTLSMRQRPVQAVVGPASALRDSSPMSDSAAAPDVLVLPEGDGEVVPALPWPTD